MGPGGAFTPIVSILKDALCTVLRSLENKNELLNLASNRVLKDLSSVYRGRF